MPGTLVLIGLNGPRISAGASGLGSNVSCCGGPPDRNSIITCLARPNIRAFTGCSTAEAPFAFEPSRPGKHEASADIPPIRIRSRRCSIESNALICGRGTGLSEITEIAENNVRRDSSLYQRNMKKEDGRGSRLSAALRDFERRV